MLQSVARWLLLAARVEKIKWHELRHGGPGGTTKMTCKLTMTGPKMVYVHNTYVAFDRVPERKSLHPAMNSHAGLIHSASMTMTSHHLEIVINS